MTKQKIYFIIYDGNQLYTKNTWYLTNTIYRNFEDIKNVHKLNHRLDVIKELLISDKSIIILAILNKRLIGYLVASIVETIETMHIYYLYTISRYRKYGIATKMLNIIQKYSPVNKLSLTYDTFNYDLSVFYLNNNFRYDQRFRTGGRYDTMIKFI